MQRPSRMLADRIRGDVLSRLNPGERLPTERELAARYGVGRTIVREAVLILELLELVVTRHGSGSVLASAGDAPAPMTHGPNASATIGPFELIQARLTLESAVAGLAAKVATATDLRRVKSTLEEHVVLLEHPLTDSRFRKIMTVDSRFHLEIAEATHNLALIQTVDFVRNYVGTTPEWKIFLDVYERDRDQLDLALAEHRVIFDRIFERDAGGAQKAMRDHIFRKWGGLRDELVQRKLLLDTKLFAIDLDLDL